MADIITIPFTTDFMDALTAHIDAQWIRPGRPLERLAVVFGGKRPEHFLKRALARKIGRPFLPPRIFTIDEFMGEVSGTAPQWRPSSDLEDRYEIYQLVAARYPAMLKGRESFARFLPWAGDILNFIAELDIEDIDPERIRNVEESARIGYAIPPGINDLLSQVMDLRGAFHERILAGGRITRGLRYRRAKENVTAWKPPFDGIIFANFFYFHRTEEAVVKDLHARGLAALLFQGDQRKWPVLERVGRQFGVVLHEPDEAGRPAAAPLRTAFALKAYCAPDPHAEAAAARNILMKIPTQEWHETVVILPDPKALVALLSAFPEECRDFNVSMGYSLRRSSLFVLLQSVFKAQLSRKGAAYYAKDYLAVIRHPLVKNLRSPGDPVATRILVHKIEEALKGRLACGIAGKLFVTPDEVCDTPEIFTAAAELLAGMGQTVSRDDLKESLATLHHLFFTVWGAVGDLKAVSEALGLFLTTLRSFSPMGEYPLNGNIAQKLDEMREEWARASFARERFAREEVFRIVEEMAGKAAVYFKGTPLKGLQVLGLFETRSLHFKHVIVMDANEGVLPKVEDNASLIPREVMVQLGVDRLKLDEEIQRYQFMRVISSAEHVHVIYQKNREKEPSRFLEELVWEQQRREGALRPYPTEKIMFRVEVHAGERRVVKTPGMMAFLKDFEFSASSLNAYIKNPYEFYWRYVAGLREQDDMLDESDAAQVGTFLHDLLEAAYKPFAGRELLIDDDFRHRFEAVFAAHFKASFEARMRSDAFMVRAVMHNKMHQFLEQEAERALDGVRVIAVEEKFPGTLVLPAGTFRFKTRIDRIDELNDGTLVVLDYKTGTSDRIPQCPLALPEAWTREYIYEKVKSFQLPLYLYFVAQQFPGRRLDAGLYFLREAKIELFSKKGFDLNKLEESLTPYMAALNAVLAEIMDPAVPFEDNDLSDYES